MNKLLAAKVQFAAFQVNPAGELYEQEFLSLLASVESLSKHPLAQAVTDVAKKNHVPVHPVIGFKEFPGQGLGGAVEVAPRYYRPVVIGSREFIASCGLETPALLEVPARAWEKEERSLISLGGWDGWVRGVLKFERS